MTNEIRGGQDKGCNFIICVTGTQHKKTKKRSKNLKNSQRAPFIKKARTQTTVKGINIHPTSHGHRPFPIHVRPQLKRRRKKPGWPWAPCGWGPCGCAYRRSASPAVLAWTRFAHSHSHCILLLLLFSALTPCHCFFLLCIPAIVSISCALLPFLCVFLTCI